MRKDETRVTNVKSTNFTIVEMCRS